jgi:hypothetical protein
MNYAIMNESTPKIFVINKNEAVDKLGQCNENLHDRYRLQENLSALRWSNYNYLLYYEYIMKKDLTTRILKSYEGNMERRVVYQTVS